jgi:GNAT superfamily N-acetyltransferase
MGSESALDPRTITIRPFGRDDTLNRFGCGKDAIDKWLKNQAKKHSDRDQVRVFMAYIEGEPFPIGFYALRIADEKTSVFAETPNDYTKNLDSFGVIYLAYLAVAEPFQKQGVGMYLLGHAIEKCHDILMNAGYYALTLQSINEDSTAFYRKLNFVEYAGDPKQPKMMLLASNIRKLIEEA